MDNTNLYQQTLHDLQTRRSSCLGELKKLDSAISALSATMTAAALIAPAPPPPPPPHIAKPSDWKQRFANMSVRWAILKLFAHSALDFDGDHPLTSAEVSAELLEGGNMKALRPTVSAVISDMVNQRKELISNEAGGYTLTDNGRAAWSAIAHSSRYLNRDSPSSEP
jgi:hypothetical protein